MPILNYYKQADYLHYNKYLCYKNMPNSRKRHHSRSRSRSRSYSPDHTVCDYKRKKYDDVSREKIEIRKRSSSSDPGHVEYTADEKDCAEDLKHITTDENNENHSKDDTNMKSERDPNADEFMEGKGNMDSIPEENEISSAEIEVENNSKGDECTEDKGDVESVHEKNRNSTSAGIEVQENLKGDACMEVNSDEEMNEGKSNETLDSNADEDAVVVLDETEEETTLNTSTSKQPEKTPTKRSGLKKKHESEQKRINRQKEKEERERAKNEEKERILQEKIKKKEERKREHEQKQKEKEMKEEMKKKEREEKEEQRKKEKEEKEEQRKKEKEEKEQKRKEKEEKEEQKRKEREQEKIKKQQEIEEKNKEKIKEEEKKQKAAAAFVNFFVPKKSDCTQEEKKPHYAAFMAFEIKSDMKLPLPRRSTLTEEEKKSLDSQLEQQNLETSYLKELKSGKTIGRSSKTWPYEESSDDDVTIVNLGETICEDKSTLLKARAKFFKFRENRRPAYFGTWRKKSKFISPRRPFTEDKEHLNYAEDSDDDWEEEEQGESLNGSEDEAEKETEEEKDDYEVDNDFFVPHGHLSEDEIDDEEKSKLSPECLKQKLKLLKEEFDQDMQSKTNKLKPRSIGCIWYNKDGSNVDEALNKYLQPLAIISKGSIVIKKRSEISIAAKYGKVKMSKELNPEHIPVFLKIVHGNTNKKIVVVEQFLSHMEKTGLTVDMSKAKLVKKLKQFAKWRKGVENGPLKNKFGWFVHKEFKLKYDVDLA